LKKVEQISAKRLFMVLEQYSVLIRWDERQAIYRASVPEYPGYTTQGQTRKEALKNIEAVMEVLLPTLQSLANLPSSPKPGEEGPKSILPPGTEEI
jgi:predicted RNase H-like HicB family nuclease